MSEHLPAFLLGLTTGAIGGPLLVWAAWAVGNNTLVKDQRIKCLYCDWVAPSNGRNGARWPNKARFAFHVQTPSHKRRRMTSGH